MTRNGTAADRAHLPAGPIEEYLIVGELSKDSAFAASKESSGRLSASWTRSRTKAANASGHLRVVGACDASTRVSARAKLSTKDPEHVLLRTVVGRPGDLLNSELEWWARAALAF